ncbi:MAG: hypothetical protein KAH32_07785, partial [Chlamydiia bacterium]|nr:hypothetical protein [Chlamydiia bacterium]
ILQTGCPAGSTEYGFSGWTTNNPVTMKYELVESDYAQEDNFTRPYYTRVCDNNFDCSNIFFGENTTIGINHFPYAVNVEMLNDINGTYLNVTHNITCNYSFSDMDNALYNDPINKNVSLYREEADTDFAWYLYESGSWTEQTSYTNQVLPNTATALGDRWKCGIVTNDGYTDGPETFSTFRIIGDDGPIIESVTSNADDENEPLTKGDTLTFSVDWYDPDQENDEQIDLYICENYDVAQGSGCVDQTFCEVENTYMDPISCSMSSSEFDYFNTTFVATIYDLNGSMAQYNGSVYVNAEPTIENVTLKGATSGEVYPLSSENLICAGEGNDTDNLTGVDYYYYWYRDRGSGFQTYTYPTTADTMLSQYTDIGDIWKCTVKICDEFMCTDEEESNTVFLTQYGTNETPSIQTITVDSTPSEPTNVGDPVVFTINWTDADLAEGEYVRAFICNSSDIIENAGCVDKTFAQTEFTSSIPLIASYTVSEDENGNEQAFIILCDDEEVCSEQSNISFYVNHVPEANNVVVVNSTNGTYFDENTFLNCSYDFYDNDENFSYNSSYNSSFGSYFFWYKYVSGSWVDQDKNVQILPSTYTTLGEAWKCGVVVSDGYATNNEVLAEPIAIGNINPVIEDVTLNSAYDDPVKYAEDAEFSIDWFDATSNEEVEIFVCNSEDHNRYGCVGITLCSLTSTSQSPYECNYDTSGLSEGVVNQSYFVYIYDSTELNGSYNSWDNENNLFINHAPSITSVNLTGDAGNVFPTTDEDLICNNSVIIEIDDGNITLDYNTTSMIYTWYLDQGAGFVTYPYSGQVLTSWHTLEGEYWKCLATPTDGYHQGTGISSQIRYIYGDSVSEVPEIAYVSVNSNTSNPTKVGEGAVFTINWLDSDQPFGEIVDVYICRDANRYNNGGCITPYIESYSVSTNPIVINYTTIDNDYSTAGYFIQLEDSNGNISGWYNSSEEDNNFSVNHRPNITSLQTIQTDVDTLECDFEYHNSSYSGLWSDNNIQNDYSTDNSWFKWYKYNSGWQEITSANEHSEYLTEGFSAGDLIKCKVMVGDEWGLTDTQYRDGGSVEVQPAPEIPIVWSISGTTNDNNVSIIGYIDESDLNPLSAQVYSWQGYEEPKIDNTTVLVSSILMGTSSVIDNFNQGSDYVVISGTQQSEFIAGRYVEFSNHNRTYFERYEISNKVEIIPGSQYRINLVVADSLDESVVSGTTITVHTENHPNGWFNISEFVLHNGTNDIGVRSVRDISTGNLSSNFTDSMLVVYDNIKPNIDAANVLGYATETQPLLQFSVSDNYLLNISTLVLNRTTVPGGVSVLYTVNSTSNNIACEHISSENYNCNVLIYVPDGEYILNWSVYDVAGNFNSTQMSGYMVNATNPIMPTVERTQAEYNHTNLTYNISIPTELNAGVGANATIQFAIGTNYYPYSGWDSVMEWTDITDFSTGNEYIYYSDI